MNPSLRLDYTRGTPKLPVNMEWKSTGPNDPIHFLRLEPNVHVRTQKIKQSAPSESFPLVPSASPGVYPYTGIVPAKPAEMRNASEHFGMLDHCVPASLCASEPTPDFDEHPAANFNIKGVNPPPRTTTLELTTCTGEGPDKCMYCLASAMTKQAMDRIGAK